MYVGSGNEQNNRTLLDETTNYTNMSQIIGWLVYFNMISIPISKCFHSMLRVFYALPKLYYNLDDKISNM